ncbi:Protease prtS precursor [Serratia rubidaea]|uniref:Protease prtS n=1 Tax=Serratia rubidaea TaxID=61652 RepID=A0A4U9HQR5_SERRU|nr:Protease prtS precursor [Serratia rubidaea]
MVWYDTLCDKALPQDADFATFARLTVKHAGQRFSQQVADKVQAAWRQVGVE